MGRSQETFNKKEKEKNKQKKRQEKLAKKAERKSGSKDSTLEGMMAYVDEMGNIIDSPVDPATRTEINPELIEIGISKRTDDPEPLRRMGKVAFFNHSKGYGFIRDNDDQDTAFVHINSLRIEIKDNDRVTYERVRGQKGWNAENVELI
jgi:cold shock CspA family protein